MKIENVKVSKIKVGERFRKDLGDLLQLQASIEEVKLLHPIGITVGMDLVFGARRLQAFKNMGRKEIPCVIVDADNLLKMELDENDDDIRKNFTPSEKLAIARAIEEQLGERRGNPNITKTSKKSKHAENGGIETRDVAAKTAGLGGHDNLRKMKAIEANAHQNVIDELNAENLTINDAYSVCHMDKAIQEKALDALTYDRDNLKTLKNAAKRVQQEMDADAGMAEVVRDCNGLVIPDCVRPAYESLAAVKAVQAACKELKQRIGDMYRGGVYDSQPQHLISYVKSVESEVDGVSFAFVCPCCAGDVDNTCGVCGGKRWFNRADRDKVNVKKYLKAS